MKRSGRVRTGVHYFSDKLKRKLDGVQFARATIVEAPSGYGKTTALHDYLDSKARAGIPVYWFSATEEAPSSSFRRLCLEVSKIDDEAGQRLLRVDLPNALTVGEVCDAFHAAGRLDTALGSDDGSVRFPDGGIGDNAGCERALCSSGGR
jgi:LuxR family maltose regulon positive regulatory protein